MRPPRNDWKRRAYDRRLWAAERRAEGGLLPCRRGHDGCAETDRGPCREVAT